MRLPKIGPIKVKIPRSKKSRPMPGAQKTCAIKREGEHWDLIIVCEAEHEVVFHPSTEAVGIDLGLVHLATLSDGRTIEHPRSFRAVQARLAKAQQVLARKKRGSHRRKQANKRIGKIHRKAANKRNDFLHKASRKLVTRYQTIVFEQLAPENMSRRPKPKQDAETGAYVPNGAAARSGLNTSIRNAGWAQFVRYCENKAEEADSRVLLVDPRYTSQICSGCDASKKKTLDERWHSCSCDTELDRDHNSAIAILRIGLTGEPIRRLRTKQVQARTEPSEDALLRSLRL